MRIIFKIKEIRKEKNITLKQLSKTTGVSITEINDVENHLKKPLFITAVLIAKGLKVDIKDIYKVEW